MMNWILLTLFAVMIWAVGNIVEKFVLTKYFKNPAIPTFFSCLFGLIAALITYTFAHVAFPALEVAFVPFIAGVMFMVLVYSYFKALYMEEVSRVIPLFALVPLFVSILAAIFLNEIFSIIKYAGVAFLIAGAFVISYEKKGVFKLSKAFWTMIIADIFFAASIVLVKYSLDTLSMTSNTTFFWFALGNFALIPIFFFMSKKSLFKVIKKSPKVLLYVCFSEPIAITGRYVLFTAASLGPITLISALGQTQMFFVLLFAIAVTMLWPKIIKEKINKKEIIEKLIGITLVFIGSVLVII
ncbi:MAG: DMT family transporter [Candidatus Aenigmarchaeota archaeon]|nr:DMT family transporter [Candidatus Aenigmarchaeota archaeon]